MDNKNMALNYLKARKKIDLLDYELSELPPVYKAFISNFTLGNELKLFRTVKIITDYKPTPIEIRWENSKGNNPWKIEGDRLLGMLTIEELKYEVQEYKKKIEPWHQSGLIKIGRTHGDVILLGIEENNSDKIYLYGESSSDHEVFIKIANDVLSMFSMIELNLDTELLEFHKITLEELQMNWNESFWKNKTS